MKAIVRLTPSIQLEIEEQKEMETLHKAIVLSSPRKKCSLCNSTNLYFTTNKDKEGNVYVNHRCANCGARSKLGQYKSGGYFWKEFEKYEAKEEVSPDDFIA
jgi:transposase-like protein